MQVYNALDPVKPCNSCQHGKRTLNNNYDNDLVLSFDMTVWYTLHVLILISHILNLQ